MSERFVTFAFCAQCDKTRDLDKHGRCSLCGSDSVTIRRPHQATQDSVVEALIKTVASVGGQR